MSLKTIKVNPIFLSGVSSAGTKNKTRKEKPSGVSLSQSNSIKKKLITRIKNFQQKSKPEGETMYNQQPINDAFGESVDFLNNLASTKEEQKREKKNTSLKKPRERLPNAYMNIATELPPELDWNTIAPPAATSFAATSFAATPAVIAQPVTPTSFVPSPVIAQPVIAQPVIAQPVIAQPVIAQPVIAPWQAPPQPSYGNLKTGGTKPTYRTWLRTTQKQKPTINKPVINILEDLGTTLNAEPIPATAFAATAFAATAFAAAPADDASLAQVPAAQVPATSFAAAQVPATQVPATSLPAAATQAPYTPSLKPRRKRITRTLKYKLGKHANGTVSVLIKNSQTRRKIQTEQALLKQKSILDIKNHLRSNNLLKVGSNAPSDVLRHLYEQSILAGQIENKAKDTLIHNYFNDEKK
jgi:hypothetical protein